MKVNGIRWAVIGVVLGMGTWSSYGSPLFSDSFPGTTLDAAKWVSFVPTNCEFAEVKNDGGSAYVYVYNNMGSYRVFSSLTTVDSFSIGNGLKVTAKLLFPSWGPGISSNEDMDWTLRPSFRVLNAGTGIEQMVVFSPFSRNATAGVVATSYLSGGAMPSHVTSSLSTGTWRRLELTLYRTSFNSNLYNLDGTLVDSWSGNYDSVSQVKLQFSASTGLSWPASCMYGDDVVVEAIPVAAPVLSPGSKYITVPTSVTITCGTPGAGIFYTTNGNTPTALSLPYTSAITVNPGTTVKAIAVVSGFSSEVATATYAVLTDPEEYVPFLEDSFPGTTLDPAKWVPVVPTNCEVAEVKNDAEAAYVYVYNNQGSYRVASSLTTVDSFSIDSGLKVTANLLFPAWAGGISSSYDMDWSLRPSFNILNADTETEQLVVFSPFSHNATESVVATNYLSGGAMQSRATSELLSTGIWRRLELTLYRTSFNSKLYASDGTLVDSWSGGYDAVDHVKLRFYASTGLSWPASCIMGDGVVVERAPAAAPVFNPAGPVITGPTPVTISCDTPGAYIFYTINGDTPTTASIPYASAVTINPGTTLKAIAVAYGHARSPVTGVTYTLPLTVLDTITWPFNEVTVNDGGSVFWTSLTAINPTCTHYDYNYVITKVEAKILGLIWTDITDQIPSSGLTGSGSRNGTVPFDILGPQGFGGSYNGTTVSATIHAHVDAAGRLHVDVTNADLGGVAPKARISGSVTMAGSAIVGTEAPVLVALPGSRSVDYVAGSTTFEIDNAGFGSMVWSAQVIEGGAWLSIGSGSTGTNAGTITANALANTRPVARIGTIRIISDGATGSPRDITVVQAGAPLLPGDASRDGRVDVSDLGILAANYGSTAGATWETGDFNDDGKVDVSDLGILAANYGMGTGGVLDFNRDAKALGLVADDDQTELKDDLPSASLLGCGSAGMPLVAGLFLAGLFLCGVKENE